MERTNNILIMASEMHPYAKVGGLGDVVSSLSAALKKLDNDVRVAIPRYGTLPIVRATGGLDDTVDNYDEATGEGTGFKFREPSPLALYYTVGWDIGRSPAISAASAPQFPRRVSWRRDLFRNPQNSGRGRGRAPRLAR